MVRALRADGPDEPTSAPPGTGRWCRRGAEERGSLGTGDPLQLAGRTTGRARREAGGEDGCDGNASGDASGSGDGGGDGGVGRRAKKPLPA